MFFTYHIIYDKGLLSKLAYQRYQYESVFMVLLIHGLSGLAHKFYYCNSVLWDDTRYLSVC